VSAETSDAKQLQALELDVRTLALPKKKQVSTYVSLSWTINLFTFMSRES
jgi:hypothetical protein